MLRVYYSNQIENHKDLLVRILQRDPNPDPFAEETVLVQSLGMAQWLQMQMAQHLGVVGNVQFPYPTSFLWQQYRLLFPELPKENIFERNAMTWRLMRLIPEQLAQPEFSPLAHYLQPFDQLKLYQLASKIADLFDQYLVYRPHWLIHWEKGNAQAVLAEIERAISFKHKDMSEIQATMQWQQQLWNVLVADIRQDSDELVFNTSHRAYLQQRYFEKLDNLTPAEQAKLPPRIFVFGISSLPQTQLQELQKLSQYINVHLFFTNPSQTAWMDDQEEQILEKLALKQQIPADELSQWLQEQGNPLLNMWGKQGKEFLTLLADLEYQDIDFYDELTDQPATLLTQIKQKILNAELAFDDDFQFSTQDQSITIHACYSKMREVEVLHNQLLALFEQNPSLSPKDIIVMSPDIDSYAPYINAVFGVYDRHDPRFIPFTLSDQKISHIDPIIASFLTLLSLKERQFTVDDIFDLFDVEAIREKYQLSEIQLAQLKQWICDAGIRAGLAQDNGQWQNYNSWENGINRLLLGTSLKAENQSWQGILAFDQSYGLSAELAGYLAKFMDNLTAWVAFIQQPQPLSEWKLQLTTLIAEFYQENEQSLDALLQLSQSIDALCERIAKSHFDQPIDIEVIAQLFQQQFSEQRSNLNFLVGKVNFCTLLPMRAIPFNVVCLLGMNEGEFPRQMNINSFDLMQFAPQKGDRAKRDDDRYLFLEALLSAQNVLYISYIGQSLREDSERLPSILVSQLLEYIQQNLPTGSFSVIEHPMTVFSPKNFGEGRKAYNKEWLDARLSVAERQPFLSSHAVSELPSEIELDELIAYLQSPVAFYFTRQLGVHFAKHAEPLPTAEPFVLSGLEKFNLLDELINVDLNDTDRFFNFAEFSGNLPHCHFGKLAEEELKSHIQALQTKVKPYLTQESKRIEIDYDIELGKEKGKVKLLGSIANRFENAVVQWRVGRLRDKDWVQAWVYYLLLQATNQPLDFRFYYREGPVAKLLRFKPISAEKAVQLLSRYVQDYVASVAELRWAISDNIADYLSKVDKTSAEIQCQTTLQNTEDPYIQRLLCQSPTLNYLDIHQRTLDWFSEMVLCSIEEE